MADAEVNILINIQDRLQGLENTVSELHKIDSSARELPNALEIGFGVEIVNRFVSALAQVPNQMKAAIDRGIEFNQTLEDTQVAVASVLQRFKADDFNTPAKAMQGAADAVELLKQRAATSPATIKQLAQAYTSMAGSAASAGLSTNETIDLTVLLSNAMSRLSLDMSQLQQESRALLTGNITADAALAKTLDITNEQIRLAKEQGNLYQFLTQRIGALGEASDSYTTRISNLTDALESALGELSKPLFDALSKGAKDVTAAIKGIDSKQLDNLAHALADAAQAGIDLTEWGLKNADVLITVARAAGALGLVFATIKFNQLLVNLAAMGTAFVRSKLAIHAETAALAANTTAQQANTLARTKNALAGARERFGGGSYKNIASVGGALIGAEVGAVTFGVGQWIAYKTYAREATDEAIRGLKRVEDKVRETTVKLTQQGLEIRSNADLTKVQEEIAKRQLEIERERAQIAREDGPYAKEKIASLTQQLEILTRFNQELNQEREYLIERNRAYDAAKQVLKDASDRAAEAGTRLAELTPRIKEAEEAAKPLEQRLAESGERTRELSDAMQKLIEKQEAIAKGDYGAAAPILAAEGGVDTPETAEKKAELQKNIATQIAALQAEINAEKLGEKEIEAELAALAERRKNFVAELTILELEAAGDTSGAEKLRLENEIRLKTLQIMRELKATEKEAPAIALRSIQAQRSIQAAEARAAREKAAESQVASNEAAKRDFAEQIAILQAKAAGDTAALEALERTRAIRQQALSIQKAQNVSLEEAVRLATQLYELEQAASGAKATGTRERRSGRKQLLDGGNTIRSVLAPKAAEINTRNTDTRTGLAERNASIASGLAERKQEFAVGLDRVAPVTPPVASNVFSSFTAAERGDPTGKPKENKAASAAEQAADQVAAAGEETALAVKELGSAMTGSLSKLSADLHNLQAQIRQNLNN